MKKPKTTHAEISEANRRCYNSLSDSYTDGAGDLDTLIQTGVWQEFINGGGGVNFLNVGCGAGEASAWLNEHQCNVTSTDISEAMVNLTAKKCPQSRNLVLDAIALDYFRSEQFDGILAIHLIQHLSKTMLIRFFQQVHDLLADDGVFLLVFTNTCYQASGYQPEGSQDGVYIFWHKYGLEDIIPLLNKAKLKPISYHQQKSLSGACGTVEPFSFICQKTS